MRLINRIRDTLSLLLPDLYAIVSTYSLYVPSMHTLGCSSIRFNGIEVATEIVVEDVVIGNMTEA